MVHPQACLPISSLAFECRITYRDRDGNDLSFVGS